MPIGLLINPICGCIICLGNENVEGSHGHFNYDYLCIIVFMCAANFRVQFLVTYNQRIANYFHFASFSYSTV